ncbi:hypothetical protein K7G98_24125, partial [Saccharothrix sp. MB29]|nr:hypothetical protein [Saccharothrix sp. MB29]
LYGTRASKFERLDADEIEWQKVELDPTSMRFTQSRGGGEETYRKGISVNELFIVSNTSLVTARDKVVVDIDPEILQARIERFVDPTLTDDEVRTWLFSRRSGRKYPPGDTRGWKLPAARDAVRSEDITSHIERLAYRPSIRGSSTTRNQWLIGPN